ncbi:MAG: GNAT family N-acetyltransferase [Dethiobacteria bacterium]
MAWVLNSFEKPNKAFALSRDKNDNINGFMLHSYNKETCRVELIALAKKVTGCGIGTRLFEAVEHSAFEKGYRIVNVGTHKGALLKKRLCYIQLRSSFHNLKMYQ